MQDAETPKILQVGPDAYVRQEIDNCTWLDLGDGAMVVDALEHEEKKDAVFSAIRETLGQDVQVRYLVNTHTHYDHVALNDAFASEWGAQIVNAETRRIGPEGIYLEGPERKVHMRLMAGVHTRTDCILYSQEDDLLMIGDLFGWGILPLVQQLKAESEKKLLDTYQELIEYDAQTVVAGHGPLAQTDTLRRFVEYYHWLKDQVRTRVDQGLEDREILEQIEPPEDMRHWWRFEAWKHEDTVSKVLKSVRRGWI
jgi:glyoxylase-like metal-dependent hydrolase (beta-lactamase superfamily II)